MRSIAGIAVRSGTVFVAKRRPGGSMGGKWEFPGGKVEGGESDGQAIIREFLEEFDLPALAGACLGESAFLNNGTVYALAAMLVSFDGEPSVLREHVEYSWIGAGGLQALDLADSDRSLLPFVLPLLVVV